MSVRITGRHVEITDTLRRYIEKKLARLERCLDHVQSIEVILDHHHGYEYKAELLIKDGVVSVTAKTKDADLQRAIDELIDKAERQLKKKRDKVRGATKKQKAKGSAKRLVAETALSEEIEEEGEPESAGGAAIATRKRVKAAARSVLATLDKFGIHVFPPHEEKVPSISVEEAAEALFFKDENFLCYQDADTGDLCIVYRRKDGHFGIVKPVIS